MEARSGTTVLIKTHHLPRALEDFAIKLVPKYDGPYIVSGFKSPVVLTARSLVGKTEKNVHVSQNKMFRAQDDLQ